MPKPLSKTIFDKIELMLKNGPFTFSEIGDCCGVNTSTVSQIARGKHFHQVDEVEQARRLNKRTSGTERRKPPYRPTPSEIALECERIQTSKLLARSSVDEEDREATWMPPVYSERSLLGT